MMKMPADTYWITSFGTYLAKTSPTVTASAFMITNAAPAPRNTGRYPYLAERVSIAICVLSPSSAMNVTPNAVPKAFMIMLRL